MANYIEPANIDARRFVPVTSRYAGSKTIYYTERKLLTFETYKKKTYKTSNQDRFAIVTKGYEFRPDLVSYKMYGTPDFWWKIMEANDLKDIYEFKSGLNIRIPNSLLVN